MFNKKNIFLFICFIIIISNFVWFSNVFACSRKGYSVLTINGIFAKNENDAKKNSDTLRDYFNYLHGNLSFHNQPLTVDYLYNSSHLGGLGDILDSFAQGVIDSEDSGDFDSVELLQQAAGKIKTQKVLLVAHSQGNFYANGLYGAITDKEGGIPKQSIGIYSVATPSSFVAGGGKYITSDTDKVIKRVRKINFLKKVLPPNTHIELKPGDDRLGHGFTEVYLKYKAKRIISEIKYSLDKLKTNDIQSSQNSCLAPSKISFGHKIGKNILALGDPLGSSAKVIMGKTAKVTVKTAKTVKHKVVQTAKNVKHRFIESARIMKSSATGAIRSIKSFALKTGKTMKVNAGLLSNRIKSSFSNLKNNFFESSGISKKKLISTFPINEENAQSDKQMPRDRIGAENKTKNQETKNQKKGKQNKKKQNEEKKVTKPIKNPQPQIAQKPEKSNILTFDVNKLENSSSTEIISEKNKPEEENKPEPKNKDKSANKKICSLQSIDINNVPQEELEKVVGIGPVLAGRIIEARPFSSINDLINVKGIGEKTLNKIISQNCLFVRNNHLTAQVYPQGSGGEGGVSETLPPPISYCSQENLSSPSHSPVVINEIAWMGTTNSANDEWIELKNLSNQEINLENWQLLDKGGQIKINFEEEDKIPAQGYFLLERTNDNSVPGIPADKIYTSPLANSKESLRLFNSDCQLIDEVIAEPDWPGGDNDTKQTLERKTDLTWQTSQDSGGTPKAENSQGLQEQLQQQEEQQQEEQKGEGQITYPKILISEIQIEGITASDEFVELYNPNDYEINLSNFTLKKKTSSGAESNLVCSSAFTGFIPSKGFFLIVPQINEDGTKNYQGKSSPNLYFSGKTYSITADNTILLYDPNGDLVDKVGFGSAYDFEKSPFPQNPETIDLFESWLRENGINFSGNREGSRVIVHQSLGRKINEQGNYQESDDNFEDFELQNPTPGSRNESFVEPNLEETFKNIDIIPPDVVIGSKPAISSNQAEATFTFSSNEENCSFECKIDNQSWQPCQSPKEYQNLADGQHNFSVRARDLFSNIGEASYIWTIDVANQSEAGPESISENLFKVKTVIDGDTIELENGEMVRYIGINTPETDECFFEEAKQENKDLTEGKEVRLEKDVSDKDIYGRLLRYVYVGDIFVNDYLVKRGYAQPESFSPDTKHKAQFEQSQSEAEENKLGLWGLTCPPTADAGQDKIVEINQSFTFNGTGSGDNVEIVSYKWDVDNDGVWDLEGEMPFFQGYSSAGVYTATLEVLDEAGNKDSDSLIVTVNSPAETQSETQEQLPKLEITEIMYNPEGVDSDKEWIEIKNKGDEEIDLTSIKFYENETNHSIVLIQGIEKLQANEYVVISNDNDALENFKKDFPDCSSSLFKSSFSLNNTGEKIALKFNDLIIDEIEYSKTWGASNNGKSLQKIGGQWTEENSSPGQKNIKHLNRAPSASFSFSPENPVVREEINFNSSDSTDPDGEISYYLWDFGDENFASTTQPIISHSYPNPGNYQVKLSVYGQEDLSNSTSTSISVNSKPIADFSFQPEEPIVGQSIEFNASNSSDPDGNIISYSWDFGDGNSVSTTQNFISHSFQNKGEYQISLSVFDNKNASSTISKTIEIKPSNSADHIVISEIQAGTSENSDDEFIELYNPTTKQISLDGWELRKISSAGKESNLLDNNKFTGVIPAKGFFLIASNDYSSSLSPDIYYSVKSGLLAYKDNSVVLYNGDHKTAKVIDRISYSSIEPGKSLERRSVSDNTCYPPSGEYEFSGNGCDIDTDNQDDFVLNDVPSPQNSASLSEPRKKPTIPSDFSVSFSSSTMSLDFSWGSSSDYQNTSSTIGYFVTDASGVSSTLSFSKTEQTSISKQIQEIGRDYKFSLQSFDKDGLSSEATSTEISVPSFLKSVYFYKTPDDPNLADKVRNKYFVDLNFSKYPFVPDLFNKEKTWKGVEFYLDGELTRIKYKPCYGYTKFRDRLILADDGEHCRCDGALGSVSLDFSYLEDNHLSFEIENKKEFNKNDYLTLKFYSLESSGGGSQDMGLVALDKTKYHFQGDPNFYKDKQIHSPPTTPQNLKVSFHEQEESPYFSITWDNVSDPDSLDRSIVYYLKISQSASSTLLGYFADGSGNLDKSKKVLNNVFYKVSKGFRYVERGGEYVLEQFLPIFYPLVSGEYIFSLKAGDEFNLYSEENIISTTIVVPAVLAGQTKRSDSNFNFGEYQEIAQTFKLNKDSELFSLDLILRAFSSSAIKVSLRKGKPEEYGPEIYSFNTNPLSSRKEIVSSYFPEPVYLEKGIYSLILEKVEGEAVIYGESNGLPTEEYYPDGSFWGYKNWAGSSEPFWIERTDRDLYFIIKGIEQ